MFCNIATSYKLPKQNKILIIYLNISFHQVKIILNGKKIVHDAQIDAQWIAYFLTGIGVNELALNKSASILLCAAFCTTITTVLNG